MDFFSVACFGVDSNISGDIHSVELLTSLFDGLAEVTE